MFEILHDVGMLSNDLYLFREGRESEVERFGRNAL